MDSCIHGKLIVAAVVGLAVGLLLWVSQCIAPSLVVTSFASSCATVISMPSAAASAPRTIVLGHCMSALIGIGAAALLAPTPPDYAIAAAASMAAMVLTNRLHPPAAANAILAFHLSTSSFDFFVVVLVGASMIAIIACCGRSFSCSGAMTPNFPTSSPRDPAKPQRKRKESPGLKPRRSAWCQQCFDHIDPVADDQREPDVCRAHQRRSHR
jgi:CBS-domain-containing membrane protein